MSMSTQHGGGGTRRPGVIKPGGKPTRGAAPKDPTDKVEPDQVDAVDAEAADDVDADAAEEAAEEADAPASLRPRAARAREVKARGAGKPGARPAGKGNARRPIAPVKVRKERPWGAISLFGIVGLLAAAIIGYGAWNVYENGLTPAERLGKIDGVTNFIAKDASLRQAGQHATGKLTYAQTPPVGGTHNPNWMNCMGDVYDAQIPSEHAIHSLEHGAVWVTYNPDKLDAGQVAALAKKVTGVDYMLMSPFPGIDKAVSVQAWGYQLKVDSPTDSRIDDFIKAARNKVGIEAGAVCSGGITETGTTPFDLPTGQTGGTGTGG